MRISEFLEESKRLSTPEAMRSLMEKAAADLGFDRWAYCALIGHEKYESGSNPAPAVAHNFPDDWIDYYFDNTYQQVDPVVVHAPQLEGPFLWDDLDVAFGYTEAQKTIMLEADEAGLKDGVAVPLHGPFGRTCLVTFASSDGHPNPRKELLTLNALAANFHTAYSAIGRTKGEEKKSVSLSNREKECLKWISLGKSSSEISTILKISENTVNSHIKSALKKLGAHTRTQAVIAAVYYKLIPLDLRSLPFT